jgi:hypothetical protein
LLRKGGPIRITEGLTSTSPSRAGGSQTQYRRLSGYPQGEDFVFDITDQLTITSATPV